MDTGAKLDKFHRQDGNWQAKDGGSPSSSPDSRAADKSEILEAIATCQTSLTTRIEEVKVDISLLHRDMQQLRDRVWKSEHRLGHKEDAFPPLQESSDQASRLIAQLQQKQDDLENCMRRNNLRFIGLPEGTEGNNPATFPEDLLITTYRQEAFSRSFVVERAHRMPAKKLPQGTPPRLLIAEFLNYKDRDRYPPLSQREG